MNRQNFFLQKLKLKDFRLHRILLTGVSLYGSKGVVLLVSIVSLPLILSYLGSEKFGMIETLISLVFVINFADLGLGFGLQNRLAEIDSSSEEGELKSSISSIFTALTLSSIFFLIVFLVLHTCINWSLIFNVKSPAAGEELSRSVLFFFICLILQIPFSVVQKVQNGLQEGYFNELWRGLGSIVGLVFLIVSVKSDLGAPFIILSIYGSNTLFLIINFCIYFCWQKKDLTPNFRFFEFRHLSKLYKDGIVFFSLQVATIILLTSDRVILAHYHNLSLVATYSVGYRLVVLFTTPVDAFVLPLLPALNDALAKGDMLWIKKVIKRAINVIAISSVTMCLVMIVLGSFIIQIWTQNSIDISVSSIIAFGCLILFTNLNSFFSYVMLTPKFIREIVLIYSVSVCFAVIFKFLFVSYFGIAGVIWATIIPVSLLFFTFSYKKLIESNFITTL